MCLEILEFPLLKLQNRVILTNFFWGESDGEMGYLVDQLERLAEEWQKKSGENPCNMGLPEVCGIISEDLKHKVSDHIDPRKLVVYPSIGQIILNALTPDKMRTAKNLLSDKKIDLKSLLEKLNEVRGC